MATKPNKKTRKFVNKKSYGKSLSFRAPPELLAKLRATAKHAGVPMGTMLRRVLEEAYDNAAATRAQAIDKA